MEFIRLFRAINKDDAAIAGGKGASLGEITQAGIPVPEGFALLSNAFERFLEETDLLAEIDATLQSVNKQEMHTIEHASEKIQQLILNAKMPTDIAIEIEKHFDQLGAPYVAVRSSATAEDSASAAWAGQLDSYLNTTAASLLTNVQRCWASLFTPRAIFYRFEKDLHTTKISVAVVVQKMVASEVSGIAFSVHPITEDRNQLIIEAGYGLGEAIVSGQITPDSYVVEKEPRNVIDINVNTQTRALYRAANGGNEWRDIAKPQASAQVLTSEQILQLAELVIRIEKHYGFPCDIEWAFEGSTFYIVQSRPITTLKVKSSLSNSSGIKFSDYMLNFNAKGISVLVEDTQVSNYFEGDCIEYQIGNEFFSFYKLNSVNISNEIGKDKEFYIKIEEAKETYNFNYKILQGYLKQDIFSEKDIIKVFEILKDMTSAYGFFGNHYMDGFASNLIKNGEIQKSEEMEKIGAMKNELREKVNFVFFDQDGLFEKVKKNLSEQFKIDNAVLDYYKVEEILNLINGKVVSNKEIQGRKEAYVYQVVNGDVKFFSGNEAINFIRNFRVDNSNNKVIQGQKANGGFVKGRIRLIDSDYSNYKKLSIAMSEMQEGEILLSQITAPELMPAIKKSIGIITDTGGMLSHAAITSRELKIPCIVGCIDATKKLKTGDLVELDATAGIVRILECHE